MTYIRLLWRRLLLVPFLFLLPFPIFASQLSLESADASGVTLRLEVDDFKIGELPVDGTSYQTVSYDGSYPSTEVGQPALPTSHAMLGVPPGAQVRVRVLDTTTQIRPGIRVAPVPTGKPTSTGDGFETADYRYDTTGDAYVTGRRYPGELALVRYDGLIRSQRVIQVELRPAQYEHGARRLVLHPQMRVRVDFIGGAAAPALGSALPDSPTFEDSLRGTLINYQEARRWRLPRPRVMAAPPAAMPLETQLKILVEEEGVYRLGYEDLKASWGALVDTTDPRQWYLTKDGAVLPIYVRGEHDGRFEPGDFVFFYAPRARRIYSRWDVYWLAIGEKPGARVVEVDGLASSSIARFVNSFRSKFHFEENELHSVLDQVRPKPGELNTWFEKHDHWFWKGIKNRGERNDTEVQFPLYDVADSLEKPSIHVVLQGGTPVLHQAVPMINGIRIANAEWKDQDSWETSLTLPAHALTDVVSSLNTLSLVRADMNQEEDSTKYPYHMYINSFDIEYTRMLRAVGDTLRFRSPASDEDYEVLKRRSLEYRVLHFLDPDIEIFEMDGDHITGRLQGVSVQSYVLSRKERDRIRRIREIRGEDPTDIPATAYRVRFQQLATHDAEFVAVSARGAKLPVRVDAVQPSRLRDPSNGADYLVISSPPYLEAAQRLVEWRATSAGGGYRTMLVSTDDIYNEFNHGVLDPKAIKDFLRYAYENWQAPAPTFAVLLGDGTFDFHGVDRERYPEPPEWMGYIPTHYIWTTFGETAVDHWYTTVSGVDALPDLYLGRLSAESLDQAHAIVDKIIDYDSKRPNGKWRRKIISVADDDVNNPSDFIFKKSLTEISQNYSLLGYETVKIFLEDITDAVEADPAAYGNRLPGQVTKEIILKALDKGSVLVQYAGHGGPHVWAHEIIFDNLAIERLQENPRLPFLLVLSCYNGYFDAPAEPSMAEAFLRLPRAGVIGMYSATRLTFGTGNDLLNRIVFDIIFRQNVRQLGPIVFGSKLTQLISGGLGELEVMEAYTLFGDPATQLALTDYDFAPEIPEPSVAPGQTLRIAAGQVARAVYDARQGTKVYEPVDTFSGRLEVTVRYPDDQTDQQMLDIQGGRYPEIQFTLPTSVADGQARIEFYAENQTEIAMGGAVFSVRIPRVQQTVETVDAVGLHLFVQVADDLRDAGIERVSLNWRDPVRRRWETAEMVRDTTRGPGWYRTENALPIPTNGDALKYHILMTDTQGNSIVSETQEYRSLKLPDLRVVESLANRVPLISYEYIPEWGGWGIRVEVQSTDSVPIDQPVRIAVYAGNPDMDGDAVVDGTAQLLGEARIQPQAWQPVDPFHPHPPHDDPMLPRAQSEDPLDTYHVAVAFVPRQLEPGNYMLFAWIDPDGSDPQGEIRETLDSNNISDRVLAITAQRAGEASVQIESLDDALSAQLPASAFAEPMVVRVTPLETSEVPPLSTQPMLSPALLVGAPAYRVGSEAAGKKLQTPVSLRLRVSTSAVREQIKAQLGLADLDEEALTADQRSSIDFAVQELVQQMAGYVWSETIGKWIRLPSTPALDASGKLLLLPSVAGITTENVGEASISDILVDDQQTPAGDWVVFFTGMTTYRLYHASGDGMLELVLTDQSVYEYPEGSPASPEGKAMGLQFELTDKVLQFGDVLKFRTIESFNPDRTISTSGAVSFNRGDGVIRTIQTSPETPFDVWGVLFLDDRHFQVEGRKTGLLSRDGQTLVGELGVDFTHEPTGLKLHILAGSKPFSPGDRFVFRTEASGIIQAETPLLGTFRVMSSEDVKEPDIRVRVAGQDFADGDPVSRTPYLQAILSDDNGIDLVTRPLAVTLSTNDGAYEPIPEGEALLNYQPGGRQVVWNWLPTLEPGRYALRVEAYDVDGHANADEIEFFVSRSLELTALNYPNPFRTDTTITAELTAPVDELEVRIYTLAGRLVRVFREHQVVGFVPIFWDGRDDEGDPIANGVYYGKVTARTEDGPKRTVELKMLKLR